MISFLLKFPLVAISVNDRLFSKANMMLLFLTISHQILHYSLRGNPRAKAGGATVPSLKSQRDPGEYIAFPRAFLPYLRVIIRLFSQFQKSLRS